MFLSFSGNDSVEILIGYEEIDFEFLYEKVEYVLLNVGN